MTPDQIRARTRVDSNVTVTYRVGPRPTGASRTATVYGTVIDHSGDSLILGVHPSMLIIPFFAIDSID